MDSEIEISLSEIVRFLKNGLVLALIVGSALAALAFIVSEQRTPQYRASATAYAAERGLDLGSFGLPQLNASTLHIDTYKAAAISDPVLSLGLDLLGTEQVDQRTIRQLAVRTVVRTDERPRLLHITVVAPSPEQAAAEANALIEALVRWDRDRAGSSIGRVVATLGQQIASLEAEVTRLEGLTGSVAEQQLASRRALLAQQQERLNYALALEVSVAGLVEVVQPASVSSSPIGTSSRFNAALAALLGIVLGYGARYFRSALDTNMRDPEELVEVSGLPVLATFPKLGRRGKTALREAASFLRANLLHLTRNDHPPIVLVTSPTADQGKTTVAASLAESLARNGYRTLLVDGDLRNPSIAKHFQMRGFNHLTVVEALNRSTDLRVPTSMEVGGDATLHVLPGGKPMPQAAEFLGSTFEYALDRWSAGYQAIVIDSPPALAVADSLIMARHCTGVLVVVNAESSDRRQVRQTVDLLSRSDNRLLGIVATHVDRRAVVSYGYPSEEGRTVLGGARKIRSGGSTGEPAP